MKRNSWRRPIFGLYDAGYHRRTSATLAVGSEFRFGDVEGAYKIASITQLVLRSRGNRQLHGGSRRADGQHRQA